MLSIRHKISKRSGIESPSGGGGVGVSGSARKYWRKYFQSVPNMMGPNDQINYLIASDYAGAKPLHRIILNSGEPGEIRQSSKFFYLAAIRQNRRHDVIFIQPSYKEPPEEVRNFRLTDEWLDKVFKGEIKKRQRGAAK
jgi:hypothetical protein